jgi:hypothetical protein
MYRLIATGVALAAVLATALASVAPAAAEGVTPAQLTNAGWTCFVPPPFPDRIVCGNPGLGLPPVPPVADGRPAYTILLFNRDGSFRGTELLIRPDLYHGQPCPHSAWVFNPRIGYYECRHF